MVLFTEDVDHMYMGSRKAARISDYAMDDDEDLSRRSQKKDRALMDDITTKLVRGEMAKEGGRGGEGKGDGRVKR